MKRCDPPGEGPRYRAAKELRKVDVAPMSAGLRAAVIPAAMRGKDHPLDEVRRKTPAAPAPPPLCPRCDLTAYGIDSGGWRAATAVVPIEVVA